MAFRSRGLPLEQWRDGVMTRMRVSALNGGQATLHLRSVLRSGPWRAMGELGYSRQALNIARASRRRAGAPRWRKQSGVLGEPICRHVGINSDITRRIT